jgi:hypothetical protein
MSPGVALLLVFEAWRGDHPDAVSRRAGVRLNVHRGRGGLAWDTIPRDRAWPCVLLRPCFR